MDGWRAVSGGILIQLLKLSWPVSIYFREREMERRDRERQRENSVSNWCHCSSAVQCSTLHYMFETRDIYWNRMAHIIARTYVVFILANEVTLSLLKLSSWHHFICQLINFITVKLSNHQNYKVTRQLCTQCLSSKLMDDVSLPK